MRIKLLASLLLVEFFILVRSMDKKPERERQTRRVKDQSKCPVTLPQKATRKCKLLREKELENQRGIYQFAPRPPLQNERVNMTMQQIINHNLRDEFLKEHLGTYVSMLRRNKAFTDHWLAQHPKEITAFQGYKNMFSDFRSALGSNGSTGFFRFASNTEPFRDILNDWRDDEIFAEQRLSGINPMVLRRVTDDFSDVGLKWSELSKVLNPNYNWEAAIQAASLNDDTLDEAIKNGNVYVLRYDFFDDMISFPDLVDHNPNRTVWPLTSPVALFAMRTEGQDKRLRPAAIQIDYKPDSPVFSPADGGSWMLAKMVVQATDYAHSQMIEHLLKIHIFSEPICAVLYRQLSNKHPLNELLKYHCRGLIAVNAIGAPPLFFPLGYMDRLSAMGRKGTVLLLSRGLKTFSWKLADLHLDMKERGLDDKTMLPYFPYRDDSELLSTVIGKMVKDYVGIYYRSNRHVRQDKELQAFAHELSTKRTGPDGEHGPLVKDFPATFNTKNEVADMVTKLIWFLCVKHSVVNFPMSDYGAFTPVLPTKVYNDTRVPTGEFSVFNFPNSLISSTQILVAVNVGMYHYDTLFDYYGELSNPLASRVVGFYYYYLKYDVTEVLKDRNNKRFQSGHLTYPYLQYPWLPNGVST